MFEWRPFFNNFGTIQNNTALKLFSQALLYLLNFGTIQNNTALKLLSYAPLAGR